MSEMIPHHYNADHNTTSANIIVPFLLEHIDVGSMIDIGCGLGQWPYVFKNYGAKEIVGIDGAHVPREARKIRQFHEFDLTRLPLVKKFLQDTYNKKFDLCVCLEVAEHLPESMAKEFVALLTSTSDFVLFSAAIPYQTGENHINEQPHEYWINIFSEKGYTCCDMFRKNFWNNASVNWWYRQNMFLFINKGCRLKKEIACTYDGNCYIHPEMLKIYIAKASKPGLTPKRILAKLRSLPRW